MNKKAMLLALAVYLGLLAVMFGWSAKTGFFYKNFYQKTDKTLFLSADYDDVTFFKIEKMPVKILMVPNRLNRSEEAVFRKQGLVLVWKLWDDLDWPDFSQRFQPGDGLLLSGEELINKPFFPLALARLVKEKNGFVVVNEFSPIKSSKTFFQACPPGALLKGHIIGTRETGTPKAALWMVRLQRAVSERWVRFLCVRFSPSWSPDENLKFQADIQRNFLEKGYQFKIFFEDCNEFFRMRGSHLQFRSLAILGISIVTPVFIVLLIHLFSFRSAWAAFFLMSIFSVLSGVVISALGAVPEMVFGVTPLRGIKLQLLAPLFFGLIFMLSNRERREILESSVQVKHVVWCGLGLSVLLFLYLSRSGNHPLISVTESERGFRDTLEAFFGARPRFKEFLFAHPLFIYGLLNVRKEFFKGRFFIWLGLIGQISILNTFTHFHTPVAFGILRSFHGCWLGALISLPFCALFSRIRRA